jgi:hypothetical protein
MALAVTGMLLPADTNESHNSVTGLPVPLRIMCRLTSGNR